MRSYKSLTSLKDTIVSIHETHVNAKWWIRCFTITELICYSSLKAEGKSNESSRKLLQKEIYWLRKGSKMFSTQTLVELLSNQKNLSNNTTLNGQKISIYKSVINLDNLRKVFKLLKAFSISGVDSHIKATFKLQLSRSLEKLHWELKNQKYKSCPINVVHLLKSSGGTWPLGISSVKDKIVQTVFYKELVAGYESIFYDCSFGFRPKKSCHSVFKQIKKMAVCKMVY